MSDSPQAFADQVLDRRAATLLLPQHSLRFIPGGHTLVVTFMSALANHLKPLASALDEGIWGEDFLGKRGHAILGVGRRRNDWYLDADLQAAMETLAARGVFRQYRRVIFYGGSMGGFGALTYARLAPGAVVLAHNPQTTLRREDTSWDTRYEHGRQYDWSGAYGDAATGAALAQRVYVSYDPYLREDLRHVQRLPRHNLVPLRVPCVGHQMPIWLQQLKLLAPVFDGVADGSLNSELFRQWARSRVELARYWFTLAQRRRHRRWREVFAERARSLGPGDPQPREFLKLLTRPRHRPPPTPRRVYWVGSEADARRVVALLPQLQPGAQPLLDPFKDPARGYDLAVSAKKAAHLSMVAEEIERHLSVGATPVLILTPDDPAVDFAWARALHAQGYEAVVMTCRALEPDQALDAALQRATAFQRLTAWMAWQGMPVHPLPLDAPAPRNLPQALAPWWAALALDAGALALSEAPPAQHWLRQLRPGPAILPAMLQLEVEEVSPARTKIDPVLPVHAWGADVVISGLVLPPCLPPSVTCHLRQGDAGPPLTWPQPSPGGVAQFPGQATARQARFGHRIIRADPDRDAALEVHAKDGGIEVLARFRFRPCGRQRPQPGLYLAPWSLGYVPLAGTGALALCHQLLLLLHPPREPWPVDPQDQRACLTRWFTDVSGADWRFSVVTDPFERFARLHRRVLRHERLRGLPDIQTLDRFVHHFDACLALRPDWAAAFRPQAESLQDRPPDAVFSAEDLSPLADTLKDRWGLTLGPAPDPAPATTRPAWWKRLTGQARVTPEDFPSDATRAWILERYAQDVSLQNAVTAGPRTGT